MGRLWHKVVKALPGFKLDYLIKEFVMKLNIYLLILSSLVLTSCGDDDDTTAPVVSGTSPIETQDAFQILNNTLTSLAATFPAATCDPITGAPTTTIGSSTFVTDHLFCSLNASANTNGSVRGGYARPAGILCAVTKTSPLLNTTTATIHDNIMISETDPCFPSGGIDLNNDGDSADIVPISFRETTGAQGDYDTKVEMQTNATTFNTSGMSNLTLFLKNNAELSAAKSISNAAVSETVLKKSTGEVFYDNRNYMSFHHTRMYAKGTLNGNGTISSLTNLQIVASTGNTGSEQYSVLYVTDGTNTWMDQYVGTTRAAGFDTCTTATPGGTPDCTALVIPYNAGFHNFTANPANNYNNGTMMATTSPITMSF